MADDKNQSVLAKIRTGVAKGVKQEIQGAKESALETVFDVPLFGTVLKNIYGQFKDKKEKSDDKGVADKSIRSIDSTLRNIEKSIIQISDNVYNIAGVVGAQLTSLQDTEESLRKQREEEERAREEADTEARKRGDATPVRGDKQADQGGMLGALSGMFGARAGGALATGAKGLLSIITNPYVLIAGLVGAIGYGVYKYFTDDGFKETINDIFQKVMDFDVAENIIKPLGDVFINIAAGLSKLAGMMINYISDLSIPIPEFAQKMFGLPGELKPFGFMKGAGEKLEGWADKVFKERRDEKAAKKAAEKAAIPPEARPSMAPPGTVMATPSGEIQTTWAESVEVAYVKAMPAGKAPTITGSDKSVMDMIKSHEGVRLEPYKDSQGLWTVGVGHLIGDGRTLPPEWNRRFTEQEVDALFAQDYATHKAAAEKIPGYSNLNEKGKAAVIDLTFNMGPSWHKKWPGFTKALAEGDVQGAVDSLRNSKWFQQVGNRGSTIVSLISSGFTKTSGAAQGTAIAAAPPSPVPATSPQKATGAGSVASLTTSPTRAPGASVAAAAPIEPTTGTTVSTLSSSVAERKVAVPKSNIAVDNSSKSTSKMASIMNGGIPSPIADRCSFDRYNFFEPVGNMKVA